MFSEFSYIAFFSFGCPLLAMFLIIVWREIWVSYSCHHRIIVDFSVGCACGILAIGYAVLLGYHIALTTVLLDDYWRPLVFGSTILFLIFFAARHFGKAVWD